MIYVGIDIAKFSHFASVINSDGTVLVKPFAFENSKSGFVLFLSKIKQFDLDSCLIGLESTGHYGDNLICFLSAKGYQVGMINPIQTDSLRSSNIRKTKNDKIDTFLIARCLELGYYSILQEKDLNMIKLRTLCRFRFDILKSQTKLKTQLVVCLDMLFPELYYFFKKNLHIKTSYALLSKYTSPKEVANARIDTLAKLLSSVSRGHYSYDVAVRLKTLAKNSIGIDNPAISKQLTCIIEQLSLLKKQIDCIDKDIKQIMILLNSPILSIPGISYNLGSIILSEIGDIKRFSTSKKLLAYAGLDPSVKQSGNFNANTTRISKRGSKHLRYAIQRAASLIIWNNDVFYRYYTAKMSKGKSHNNAVGHVSHKLVRVLFKVLTENIPFNLN